MSREQELRAAVADFFSDDEIELQTGKLRDIACKARILRVDLRDYFRGSSPIASAAATYKCEICGRIFENERGLLAHVGRKHK